jgi:antiviral helicase SKI2
MKGLDVIYGIAERIEAVQDAHSVRHDEFVTQWKHGLVEVVYEWAKGMVCDSYMPCSMLIVRLW